MGIKPLLTSCLIIHAVNDAVDACLLFLEHDLGWVIGNTLWIAWGMVVLWSLHCREDLWFMAFFGGSAVIASIVVVIHWQQGCLQWFSGNADVFNMILICLGTSISVDIHRRQRHALREAHDLVQADMSNYDRIWDQERNKDHLTELERVVQS